MPKNMLSHMDYLQDEVKGLWVVCDQPLDVHQDESLGELGLQGGDDVLDYGTILN